MGRTVNALWLSTLRGSVHVFARGRQAPAQELCIDVTDDGGGRCLPTTWVDRMTNRITDHPTPSASLDRVSSGARSVVLQLKVSAGIG